MKNILKKAALAAGMLALGTTSFAQCDTTGFRAMRDELYRNFNELEIPGCPKPFFISYMLVRGHSIHVDANLGAISRVEQNPIMMPFVRTLIGNYRFTSEEAGMFQNAGAGGAFPMESDYDAVRDYFWKATDASYKYAVRSYAARQNRMRQQNVSPDELPDDLSRIIPENTIVDYPLPTTAFDEARCAAYVREAAKLIDSFREIDRNSVSLYGVQAETMILTSEGAEVVTPYNFVTMDIYGSVTNDRHERISNSLSLRVPTVGDLPPVEELRARIEAFAKELIATAAARPVEDNYFGPVLFEDEAVALFIDQQLTPMLMNAKAPVGQKNVRLPEQKLGKRIAAQEVSITVRPRMNEYGGVKLWGAFDADIDGVRPEDSLSLVREGLLCNLMSNRVCTRKVNTSNGYSRFMLTQKGFGQMPAPGTLELSVSRTFALSQARQALLEEARLEGLEYAYIIRTLSLSGEQLKAPVLRRIYVADGHEEAASPALLSFESTVARRIVSASQEKAGYNCTNSGILCSYVCPRDLILREVDIAPFESSRTQQPVVPNPRF